MAYTDLPHGIYSTDCMRIILKFSCRAFWMTHWSETTIVSVRNTWAFWTGLTPMSEPRTLKHGITPFPLWRWAVILCTDLHHLAPGMWWTIGTIKLTSVLHSSWGPQLCCSWWHNFLWCIWLPPAECHTLPLWCWYMSDAAHSPYMFRFEILPLITIQSWFRMHRIPLHLLRHHHILWFWNILSNPHTVQYYALGPGHSALIHHQLAMLLPPHPHRHCRRCGPPTRRHYWFLAQTSQVQSEPVVASWRSGCYRARWFCHLDLGPPRYPLASPNAGCHPCNWCTSECWGEWFWSLPPQVPLRRSNCLEEEHSPFTLLPWWWPWHWVLGSPPVGSDTWLYRKWFYPPSVGSSPVVRGRYSSTIHTGPHHQVRSTTCDLLQFCRTSSNHCHSWSWSSLSDWFSLLSALTWKLLEENLCWFTTAGEHGATWWRWTWSEARVYDCPCHQ